MSSDEKSPDSNEQSEKKDDATLDGEIEAGAPDLESDDPSNSEIEEVDAEIVSDGSAQDLNDADFVQGDEPGLGDVEAELSDDDNAEKEKSGSSVSPGLILAGIAVSAVCLIAFSIFRTNPADSARIESAELAETSNIDERANELSDNVATDVSRTQSDAEVPDETLTQDAPTEVTTLELPSTDEVSETASLFDKISNDAQGLAKSTLNDETRMASLQSDAAEIQNEIEAAGGLATELPPAPDGDAFNNEGLQEAAKDALATLDTSDLDQVSEETIETIDETFNEIDEGTSAPEELAEETTSDIADPLTADVSSFEEEQNADDASAETALAASDVPLLEDTPTEDENDGDVSGHDSAMAVTSDVTDINDQDANSSGSEPNENTTAKDIELTENEPTDNNEFSTSSEQDFEEMPTETVADTFEESTPAGVAEVSASLNDGETNEPSAAEAEANRLADEIAALRLAFEAQAEEFGAALEEERESSERQAEEIADLKTSFQSELAERLEQTAVQIAALQARLEGGTTNADETAGQQAAAVLALASLTTTIDSGAPYDRELSVLSRLSPRSPDIEALRIHASSGVPTLGQLKEHFDPIARASIAAASRENASGILGGLRANIEELVSVRPAEYTEGDTAPAIISRAEDSLRKDDLNKAIEFLGELEGAAAAAFEPWVTDANARINASTAISSLNTALLSALDR